MSRMHHLRQRMLQAAERHEELRSSDSHNEVASPPSRPSPPPPRERSPSPVRPVDPLTPFSPGDNASEGVVLSINVLPKKPGLAASGEIPAALLNSTSLLRAQMKRRYNTAAESVKDYIRSKYGSALRDAGALDDDDDISVEERKLHTEEPQRVLLTGSGRASSDVSEEYEDGDDFAEAKHDVSKKRAKKRSVKRKASHEINVETKRPRVEVKAAASEKEAVQVEGDGEGEEDEDDMEIDIGVSVKARDERSKESDVVGESMVGENESEEIDVSGVKDELEGDEPDEKLSVLVEVNTVLTSNDEEDGDVDVEDEVDVAVKVEEEPSVLVQVEVETKEVEVTENFPQAKSQEESEDIDVDSISILKSLKEVKPEVNALPATALPAPLPRTEPDEDDFESDEKDEDFNFDKNVDEEEDIEEDYELEVPDKNKKSKGRKASPPKKLHRERPSSSKERALEMPLEQKRRAKEEREAKLRERKAKAARKELENLRIDTDMEKKIFSFTKAPKTKVKDISSSEEELSIDVDGHFEPIEFTPLPTPNPTPFATPYDSPKSAPASPFRPRPSGSK